MASGASMPSSTEAEYRRCVVRDSKTEKLNAKFFTAHAKSGVTQFMTENLWPKHGAGASMKKKAARRYMAGVEIRRLADGHPLPGQQGLFATQNFTQFDVIGEYVGVVLKQGDGGGEYVACLEDGPHDQVLGLDAGSSGNEARFINSCLGIGDGETERGDENCLRGNVAAYEARFINSCLGIGDGKPNVVMKTAYVETLPHILIIARRDIEVGEELLLDYGEAYTRAYFQDRSAKGTAPIELPAKQNKIAEDVNWDELSPMQQQEGGDY
eukprot:CAMPEP_0171985054 /NCGR_PEP_ID=MMETSP0993-20121228/274146_1 /TAXON_ID=483369 /ORGANISM="non described non described, Strain CCMP2098" /LENGTH=268 /DNA_ID=CAMNT_0012637899 /DNA_START=250 /DNA_END=1055 /DNA_ORIENTATION=+